jgi:hypothetical protein
MVDRTDRLLRHFTELHHHGLTDLRFNLSGEGKHA